MSTPTLFQSVRVKQHGQSNYKRAKVLGFTTALALLLLGCGYCSFTPHVGKLAAPATDDSLAGKYDSLARAFEEEALDLSAIKFGRSYFQGLDPAPDGSKAHPHPYAYDELPSHPLPFPTVRILVLPVQSTMHVAMLVQMVVDSFIAILPSDALSFSLQPENYHVTLMHTSHPEDPRPDPFAIDGGTDLTLPPNKRPVATQATLDAETQAIREEAARLSAPTLVLHNVFMTRGGTLIIGWLDPEGEVVALRTRMRALFPGIASKVPGILHTTLVRLLDDRQLDNEVHKRIQQFCIEWTKNLQGLVWKPTQVMWVQETHFATVEGNQFRIPLGGA